MFHHVPGKTVDPEKIKEQEDFQRDELEPRLEEAKAGTRKSAVSLGRQAVNCVPFPL